MIELELDAGTGITTLDDDATAVYCIREGEADVVTDTGETLEPLGPGDAFGEIALLADGPAHGHRDGPHPDEAPRALGPGLRTHPTASRARAVAAQAQRGSPAAS